MPISAAMARVKGWWVPAEIGVLWGAIAMHSMVDAFRKGAASFPQSPGQKPAPVIKN